MPVMLELVSMLRPLSTWQVMLAVCLLDLALIAVRLSWPPRQGVVHLADTAQHGSFRLRQVIARQEELAQQVEASKRELADSRRQLEELMATHAASSKAQSEQLRLLASGVNDLELGIARMEEARNRRRRRNIRGAVDGFT